MKSRLVGADDSGAVMAPVRGLPSAAGVLAGERVGDGALGFGAIGVGVVVVAKFG